MKKRPARSRQNLFVQAVAGSALILAGVALVLALSPKPDTATNTSAEEWSVQPAAVNYPAPDLSLTNIDGQTKSLADFRTNVVLVNNWATWCPPCKAEMPTLVSYYADHASNGLMIIAIEAGESREDVQPYVSNFGMKFQVWLDPKTAAMAVFRNSNLPSSYVIDRRGTVRYAWTGAISRPMLEKYVTPLLGQSE